MMSVHDLCLFWTRVDVVLIMLRYCFVNFFQEGEIEGDPKRRGMFPVVFVEELGKDKL